MTAKQQLHQLISELFDVPVESLSSDTSRDNIERWDSMGTIDLVAQVERQFNVTFELMEVEELHTIGILEATLQEKGIEI